MRTLLKVKFTTDDTMHDILGSLKSTYTITSRDKRVQDMSMSYNYNPSLDQSYDLCLLLHLLSTPVTLLALQEASHSKKQENYIDLRTVNNPTQRILPHDSNKGI